MLRLLVCIGVVQGRHESTTACSAGLFTVTVKRRRLNGCAQFRAQFLFDIEENHHEVFTCSCSSTVRAGIERMRSSTGGYAGATCDCNRSRPCRTTRSAWRACRKRCDRCNRRNRRRGCKGRTGWRHDRGCSCTRTATLIGLHRKLTGQSGRQPKKSPIGGNT